MNALKSPDNNPALIDSPVITKKKEITTTTTLTNFLRSCYDGNLRNVKAILDLSPQLINEVGDIRESTGACYVACSGLHLAVRGGHRETSYELVKRGAKLDMQNQLGKFLPLLPLLNYNYNYNHKVIHR